VTTTADSRTPVLRCDLVAHAAVDSHLAVGSETVPGPVKVGWRLYDIT